MRTRSQNSSKQLNELLIKTMKSTSREKKKRIIVENLLISGANINHQDMQGNTLLHLASRASDVSLLLQLGANVNLQNFIGETPLLHIIKEDRLTCVALREKLFKKTKSIIAEFIGHAYTNMLRHDSNFVPLNLNVLDSKGNSPLFEYIHTNECNIKVIEQFVLLGASIDIKSSSQDTLLHAAVRNPYCKINVVKYLLKKGLNPNAWNSWGKTPLHFCAKSKNYQLNIVEALLKHGANVDKIDYKGYAPVHYAMMNISDNGDLLDAFLKIITSFLNKVAFLNSLLEFALKIGMNAEVLEKLITCGAQVKSCTNTALHLALNNPDCDEKLVSILLKYGARVGARDFAGFTPLHRAFERTSNMNVIKILLQSNPDMCFLIDNCISPFHLSARNPNFTVEFLIELLSTEQSIDSCLEFSRNFFLKCLEFGNEDVLKTVLKYLILKHHASICDGNLPKVINIFYENLDEDNLVNYSKFYELCMAEISRMKENKILDHITFYDVMVNEFSLLTFDLVSEEGKKKIIDIVIDTMHNEEYPSYKDMIGMFVKKQDFFLNLDAARVFSFVRKNGFVKKLILDQLSVRHIAQHLTKQDVISLIIAFSNKADSFEVKEEMSLEKMPVRPPFATNLTGELTVVISRLTQEEMMSLCKPCRVLVKDLCRPCRVVIKNDVKMMDMYLKVDPDAGCSSV